MVIIMGKIKIKPVLLVISILISASILVSCSSFGMFVVSPRVETKFDKTLIIKPYNEAREKDRVSTIFGMMEFTKQDEEVFYQSIIKSIENSGLFKRVVITDSVEEAESTRGNVYMRISNNVASFWIDEKGRLNARFNTTISFGVKNKTYFYKVYDFSQIRGLFGPHLKITLLKKVVRGVILDLEDAEME
jgi:hypothetical protein